MKTSPRFFKIIPSLLALAILAFAQSCTRDMCEVTQKYTKFTPVYMSFTELRAPDAVRSESGSDLRRPGKIYQKDNWVFVNEQGKGIHIYDNANPSSPVNLSFIAIPGNYDLAVKGNILYADSHVDLLAIDISNPQDIRVISRLQDVIPYNQWQNNTWLDPSLGVVKEWMEEEVEETYMVDCSPGRGGIGTFEDSFTSNSAGGNTTNGTQNVNPNGTGTGGSMARFTIVGDFLYTVDNTSLNFFNIASNGYPVASGTMNVGWNIETIFPHENHLFMGSTTGMFVYDITQPGTPSYICELQHIESCDPVVVQGDYAYVTLRGGTQCGNWLNQLDIIDVSDITNPILKASHPMDSPFGLGVDGPTLFVCDGASGLRIWNVADPLNASETDHLRNFETYDVIPTDGHAMVIGPDGLYQFDYSNPAAMQMLSVIPIVK